MKNNGREIAIILNDLALDGDLAKLNNFDKVTYYDYKANLMSLNPALRPFDYIILNGKLVLYINKEGAFQLKNLHGIKIISRTAEIISDVFMVTIEAQDKNGITTIECGTAPLKISIYDWPKGGRKELKGERDLTAEEKSNAYLKAHTKAMRRAILSLSGSGMLDETEANDIPDAKTMKLQDVTPDISITPEPEIYHLINEDGLISEAMNSEQLYIKLEEHLEGIDSLTALAEYEEFKSRNKEILRPFAQKHPEQARALKELSEIKKDKLLTIDGMDA